MGNTAVWARGRNGAWEILVTFRSAREVKRGGGLGKKFHVRLQRKGDRRPRAATVRLTSRAFLCEDGKLRAYAELG